MSVYKKSAELTYEFFLRRNYPEHARRIIQARANANMIRFFYPLLSFLLPLVFFSCIALFIAFFKISILSSVKGSKLAEVITDTSIQNSVIAICTIGFILSLVSLLVGLLLGFSKAKDLLFHSEQLEASIRKVWLLEKSYKLSTIGANNSETESNG